MILSLMEIQILVLDCQTSGAIPDKVRLLEIISVKMRISIIGKPDDLRSYCR